jgi:hypothetical protein
VVRTSRFHDRLAEHANAVVTKLHNSLFDVFHVERDVVPTDIAVLRQDIILIGSIILEQLEVRVIPAPQGPTPRIRAREWTFN